VIGTAPAGRERLLGERTVGGLLGVAIGGLTLLAVYDVHPPAPAHPLAVPLLVGGSLLLLAVAFGVTRRIGHEPAADWLAIGWAVVLFAAIGIAMTAELVRVLRDAVPGGAV
jgi:hypothetical protein